MLLWRPEDFSSYRHRNLLMRRELAKLPASPRDECSPPTTTRTKALLDGKGRGLRQLAGLLQLAGSLWLQLSRGAARMQATAAPLNPCPGPGRACTPRPEGATGPAQRHGCVLTQTQRSGPERPGWGPEQDPVRAKGRGP